MEPKPCNPCGPFAALPGPSDRSTARSGWPEHQGHRIVRRNASRLLVGSDSRRKEPPSSRVVARIPSTTYTFNPTLGSSLTVMLIKYVNLLGVDTVTVVWRLHSANFSQFAQTFQLLVFNVSPSVEEPQTVFLDGVNASGFVDTGVGSGPALRVFDLTSPLPSHCQVALKATQDGLSTGNMSLTMSLSIVARGRSIPAPDEL